MATVRDIIDAILTYRNSTPESSLLSSITFNGVAASAGGNITIGAPASGVALTVNAFAGQPSQVINSSGSNALKTVLASTADSQGGMAIFNSAGTRRLEIGYIGSAAGAFYGALVDGCYLNTGGSAGGLTLSTNDLARMYVNSSGNVTINAPSSGDPLNVAGSIRTSIVGDGYVRLTTGGVNSGYIEFYHSSGVRQGYIGYAVGNGGSDAGAINFVCGSVLFSGTTMLFPSVGTTASASNAFLNNGASNSLLRSTSSLRYKTNVTDLDQSAADNALNLRPITYTSKAEADDPTKVHYGLIAEEVDLIDPKLVQYTKDEQGNTIPDGVQYERLVVLLLKQMQSLRSQFNAYVAAHP